MSDSHGTHAHGVSPQADRRWLGVAFVLICGFLVVEVVAGLLSGSLALLSDAAHMLTDAAALALALIASRLAGRPSTARYTFGLKRAEILSAQANGAVLLVLAAWLAYEAVTRLVSPTDVAGGWVIATSLVGIAVNVAAVSAMRRADRTSLNIRGAYAHLVSDLYASIAALVAGVVVVTTGFDRADGIATLVVVALMVKAGVGLVVDATRVLLEAAPDALSTDRIGARLCAVDGVVEVHDLHVWELTSGYPALSAHVLVAPDADARASRRLVERALRDEFDLDHTTLQVDVLDAAAPASPGAAPSAAHCEDAHGVTYRPA